MKFTTRGFTLVELMIVIAIIGILAAALFPSMTNYLKRSRDAARASGMKDIATALGAFYSDKEKYPSKATGNCIEEAFSGQKNYLPKGIPMDPSARTASINGCSAGTTGRHYGYNTGKINAADNAFQLVAVFENEFGGNTGATSATGVLSSADISSDINNWPKGGGSGYVIFN